MNEYSYKGPVTVNGVCVERAWKASTLAVSEKKARNNLTYRYKREHSVLPSGARIFLPGKITKKGEIE